MTSRSRAGLTLVRDMPLVPEVDEDLQGLWNFEADPDLEEMDLSELKAMIEALKGTEKV